MLVAATSVSVPASLRARQQPARRCVAVAAVPPNRREVLLSATAPLLVLPFSSATALAEEAAGSAPNVVPVDKLSKPYITKQRQEYADLLRTALRADPDLDKPGAYVGCVRLLFNDAASGTRDGSAHLADELKLPQNAGLQSTVAALARVKGAVDAAAVTKDELTWADLIAFSASVITRREFRRILASNYKGGILPPGVTNDFPEPSLGCQDGTVAATQTLVPAAGASVAEWRACFEALRLGVADLAVLGPDLIQGTDAYALLSADPDVKKYLDRFESSKAVPGRTSYELAFARAVNKLQALGNFDKRKYAYAILSRNSRL
jgi:Peroxidase